MRWPTRPFRFCRHAARVIFWPRSRRPLLVEVAKTPDPDHTLVQLRSVTESLGGKASLWELFRVHRPSMRLFVKLCGACRYLAEILIRNPGMLDTVLDSLTVEQLPSFEFLQDTLRELSTNAEDLGRILQAFKVDQHLRVGVRDILARDSIEATHLALSDIAEVVLQTVAPDEYEKLATRYGLPRRSDGVDCELVIVALGKLGGRQPNYHSDLDIVFLYEESGQTSGSRPTSNQHFFSLLGTRIIKTLSHNGPQGRLYQTDCRLRPTGKSGVLATSFEEFARYFTSGAAQAWERLAICTARPVYGSQFTRQAGSKLIQLAVEAQPWSASTLAELREMRMRMQDNCLASNLKRAEGGTVDVEFIVQMLQLKHGGQHPQVLQRGTLNAARCLVRLGLLDKTQSETLCADYAFLKNVEARIRLMNAAGRHEFPDDPDMQAKLSYLLDEEDAGSLRQKTDAARKRNRASFESFFCN